MRRLGAGTVFSLVLAGCAPSPHDLAGPQYDVERLAEAIENHPGVIDARNDMGKTPLHFAVTYGRDEAVKRLLDAGADPNASDVTGMTPLHVAVTLDRLEEAEMLLEAGAGIEAKDAFGDTPLHTAALHNRTASIAFLLRNGANPRVKNEAGLRPDEAAAQNRQDDAVRRLEAALRPVTPRRAP